LREIPARGWRGTVRAGLPPARPIGGPGRPRASPRLEEDRTVRVSNPDRVYFPEILPGKPG
jgi:hypothetical protein